MAYLKELKVHNIWEVFCNIGWRFTLVFIVSPQTSKRHLFQSLCRYKQMPLTIPTFCELLLNAQKLTWIQKVT